MWLSPIVLSAIIGAVAGATAAVVTMVLIPREKRTKPLAIGLLVVLFTVLNAVGRSYVLPMFTSADVIAEVEQELLQLSVFRAMKEHYPEDYDRLLELLKSGVRKRLSREQIIAGTRTALAPLVVPRMIHASDGAIVDYMGIMVEEMRLLNEADPVLCMKFLFPDKYGHLDPEGNLPRELLDRDLDSLAAILETSAGNTVSVPPQTEIIEDLQAAFSLVQGEHGEDATVLERLEDPQVDHSLACEMTAELYDNVLQLPQERAARVIRFLFSTQI